MGATDSLIGVAFTLVVSVISFVYGKGKKDNKLAEAIQALSSSISKLDGDIAGIGTRVRSLEDRSLVHEQRFVDGDYIRSNFVSNELFKEKMNTFEQKIDGIRDSQQLMIELIKER